MYLKKRRRLYYAMHDIPIDLRPILMRKRFSASLKTDDKATAVRRAVVLEVSWRQQIQEARSGTRDHVIRDAEFWRKALEDSPPEQKELVRDIIADEAEERIQRAAARKGIVDVRDPDYDDLPEQESAARFFAAATGKLVPFDAHLDEWLATSNNVAKSKDAKASAVRDFAKDFPFIQDVGRKAVQQWVNRQGSGGKKGDTISRTLSDLRSYWRYLTSIEAVPEDILPLERLSVPRPSNKGSSVDTRKPFAAKDVVRLHRAAEQGGDQSLANLICLGMWTGARIEELCALKVKDVTDGYFEITDAKSQAGRRQVPIHSKLKATMRRLMRESADGYILSGVVPNKYEDRSNAIGKRFGRLKTAAGFGKEHVFHSIRKTVATLLENAGVAENVAADILGHFKATMTYGLYSGGNSLAVKRAAIEKLTYPSR